MDRESNSTSQEANLSGDPVDSITDLLTNEFNDTADADISDESKDDENLSDDSTNNDDNESEKTDEEESNTDEEGDKPDDEVDTEESENDTEEDSDESEDTWASVLGLEDDKIAFDEDGNFTGINTKVNGQSSIVDLKTLVAGFQNNKSNTEKSKKLAEDAKIFEKEKADIIQVYNQKLENADTLTDLLTSELTMEFDSIDWNQLRQENPAEYAAKNQDFNNKATKLAKAREAIATERYEQALKYQQQTKAANDKLLEDQFNLMVSNNPDWADKTVRKEHMDGLRSFSGAQYGFKPEEFDIIVDARIIEVLKDAQAYRQGLKTVAKKLKKPVPKFQKSKTKSSLKRKRGPNKLQHLTKQAKASTGANQRAYQIDAITELLSNGD